MDRFWRSVSIVMGALLAAGCPVTTKYGIDTGGDSGDTEQFSTAAAPVDLEAAPLPTSAVQAPMAELVSE